MTAEKLFYWFVALRDDAIERIKQLEKEVARGLLEWYALLLCQIRYTDFD